MERTCICRGHLCPQNYSPNSHVPGEASCARAVGGGGRGGDAAGRDEGQGTAGARHREE